MQNAIIALQMTQIEFAAAIGLTQPSVSKIVGGNRTLTKLHVMAIENLLREHGHDPEDLQ